jgi:hypothetical protein
MKIFAGKSAGRLQPFIEQIYNPRNRTFHTRTRNSTYFPLFSVGHPIN